MKKERMNENKHNKRKKDIQNTQKKNKERQKT